MASRSSALKCRTRIILSSAVEMDEEEFTPSGGLLARDHFLEHCGVIAEFAANYPSPRTCNNAITRTRLVLKCLIVDLAGPPLPLSRPVLAGN